MHLLILALILAENGCITCKYSYKLIRLRTPLVRSRWCARTRAPIELAPPDIRVAPYGSMSLCRSDRATRTR